MKKQLFLFFILLSSCRPNFYYDKWSREYWREDLSIFLEEGFISEEDYLNVLFFLESGGVDAFFEGKHYVQVIDYLRQRAAVKKKEVVHEECTKDSVCLQIFDSFSKGRGQCDFEIVLKNYSLQKVGLKYVQVRIYPSPFYLSSFLYYDYFKNKPLVCLPGSSQKDTMYFYAERNVNDFVRDSIFSEIEGDLCHLFSVSIDSFEVEILE